jgi:hypothetical protein
MQMVGRDSAVIQQDLAPGIRKREQEYITILFSLKITVKFKGECHGYITQKSKREEKQRPHVCSYVSVSCSSPYPHLNLFEKKTPSPRALHPIPVHPIPLDLIILIIFGEQ